MSTDSEPAAQQKLAIAASNLHFSYDEAGIFEGVNVELALGQMVGLIGANGAGKSTLLRLLLGIDKPTHGDISLFGQPLNDIARRDLARLITLVPQDSQINYAFSVEELVAMGRNPWLKRFQPAGSQDLEIIEQAMRQCDVMQFAKRSIHQLSGGERQRVLIARAIAQQTPVILLDEATASLDVCHQLEVLELSQALAEHGRLVLFAIHDLNMAARFCERLLLLADQDLYADGRPEQVLNEANLAHCFGLNAQVNSTEINGQGQLQITALSSAQKHS